MGTEMEKKLFQGLRAGHGQGSSRENKPPVYFVNLFTDIRALVGTLRSARNKNRPPDGTWPGYRTEHDPATRRNKNRPPDVTRIGHRTE